MRMSFAFLSLKQVRFLSGLIIIDPGSEHAYFIYSNKDSIEEILSVHQRAPITVGGRIPRIQRAENRPSSPSTGPLGDAVELGKPLDPATSSAIFKELTQTVPRFRDSHKPSRVLWISAYTCLLGSSHKFLEPTRLCRRRPSMYMIEPGPANRSLT